MVPCYICGQDTEPGGSSAVAGLGPCKYVCRPCVASLVAREVTRLHDQRNARNRRYLAKKGALPQEVGH